MESKQDGPALLLRYQTDTNIDDKLNIENEINDIFQVFKIDCERAQMQTCMISANEPPKGWIVTKNRGFNAVFVKSPNGKWTRFH